MQKILRLFRSSTRKTPNVNDTATPDPRFLVTFKKNEQAASNKNPTGNMPLKFGELTSRFFSN